VLGFCTHSLPICAPLQKPYLGLDKSNPDVGRPNIFSGNGTCSGGVQCLPDAHARRERSGVHLRACLSGVVHTAKGAKAAQAAESLVVCSGEPR
jgi:hypothetical protein